MPKGGDPQETPVCVICGGEFNNDRRMVGIDRNMTSLYAHRGCWHRRSELAARGVTVVGAFAESRSQFAPLQESSNP